MEKIPTEKIPTEKIPTEIIPTENVPTEITPTEKVPVAIMPKTKFPTAVNPAGKSPVASSGIPAKCNVFSTRTLTIAKRIITKIVASHHFEKSRRSIIVSSDMQFLSLLNIYL